MADKYKHLAPKRSKKPTKNFLKRQKMCINKVPYSTEDEASQFMRGEVQRAYKCPCCSQWHLTKSKSRIPDAQTES